MGKTQTGGIKLGKTQTGGIKLGKTQTGGIKWGKHKQQTGKTKRNINIISFKFYLIPNGNVIFDQ